MSQLIAVTGASGFVGQAVVAALLAAGHRVRAISRSKTPTRENIEAVAADVTDADSLVPAFAGVDAVIHLVGIILERRSRGVTFERIHVVGTRNVIDAMRRAEIRRLVHMSALGARKDAPAEYHRTKFAAEELVRSGEVAFSIFRPSLIHGPRGEFMRMAAGWARGTRLPFLFMPYFGAGLLGRGGAGRLQPIFVDDVAACFVRAIDDDSTIGQTFELGGPDEITWPQMHHIIAEAVVGKRRPVIAIPVWYATLLTSILPDHLLGTNRSQVLMSQEDNLCDPHAVTTLLGRSPISFAESVKRYANEL